MTLDSHPRTATRRPATTRPVRRPLLALTLLLHSGLAAAQVLWSEDFDSGSMPDSRIWSHDLGTGPWGTGEFTDYTDDPQNIRIEDGHLVITAREKRSGSTLTGFTSGRIRTQDKIHFKYGTLEARIKIPDLERGLWPAFWTLGQDFAEVGWPSCGELDVMEMGEAGAMNLGRGNRTVFSTAHWEHNGSHADFGGSLVTLADLDDDFHIFTMDWTPSKITTFVDGAKVWEIDITAGSCTDCTEFHQPHFVILNMAVGGNFPGVTSHGQVTAPLPGEMRVDWVRISDNGHTEVGGSGLVLGPPDIGPAHSGSWYNALQSGHGFSIEFGELPDGTPIAVVYWYTYDDQGNPIFMLGTGTPVGNRVEIEFQSPVGMVYGDFDPDSVDRQDGGTAVFEFSDRDNATFSYTPSAFTASQWGHTAIEDLALVKLLGIPADETFSQPASD